MGSAATTLVLIDSDAYVEAIRQMDVKWRNSDAVVSKMRLLESPRETEQGITRENVWLWHLRCLITTQQRSDKGSRVNAFSGDVSKKLPLPARADSDGLKDLIGGVLKSYGLRRHDIISTEASTNLKYFHEDWNELETILRDLLELRQTTDYADFEKERAAAEWVDDHLKGFGPKQSRHLLARLGLLRYEFILDSRFGKWLKTSLGFPLPVNGGLLADREYYYFISDMIRPLCERAGVLPIALDAAVFASQE